MSKQDNPPPDAGLTGAQEFLRVGIGDCLHRPEQFAAVLRVAVCGAQQCLTRVFLFGSFKFPREVSWLSGSLLLLLVLAMAFTGQLLRWDQDSFWGIVVLAEQFGKTPLIGPLLAELTIAGQQVGGATLTRFFATHVFVIPAGIFLLIGIHLYLVVLRGISDPPNPESVVVPNVELDRYERVLETRGVPFFPDVAWRDFAASAALVVGLLFLAIAVGPPALRIEADPTIINANPRPDWYFLPYFALLSLIPPEVENWVIVGVPIAIGVFLFAVPLVANRGERHWSKRPWAVAAVGVGIVAGAVLLVAGNIAPWSPNIDAVEHGTLPVSVTAGLDPQQSAGATLFVKHGCWACQAVQATGGLAGPDLSFVGDRLSPDQMTTRILNGGHNTHRDAYAVLALVIGWGFMNPANHTPYIPAATTFTTSQGVTHPYGGIMGILGAAGVVFFPRQLLCGQPGWNSPSSPHLSCAAGDAELPYCRTRSQRGGWGCRGRDVRLCARVVGRRFGPRRFRRLEVRRPRSGFRR